MYKDILVHTICKTLHVIPSEYDCEFIRTLLALSNTNLKDKAYTICHHFKRIDMVTVIYNILLSDEII